MADGLTYQERLERKAARLAEWAEKRDQKASDAHAVVTQIVQSIPMGQPIIIGSAGEGRHRAQLRRMDNKMRDAVEHSGAAATFRSRSARAAKHAEAIKAQDALGLEPYQRGDRVRVVFTRNHGIHRYEAEVVDSTLNSWKVRPFNSPYGVEDGEFVKFIHNVPRAGRPGHTANNRIEGVAE